MKWSDIPECPACGTWLCNNCGATRYQANRFSANPQDCPKCGSLDGEMVPLRHTSERLRFDHLDGFLEHTLIGDNPRYPLVKESSRGTEEEN